ncbi:Fucose 4-O-acetylase [Mucilaginibacter gossypiicola]|uniref:Fucose 4-O-acetylase n=1 Tax=Mucilaginibacter gossypiicola TaxID=551995 RepID=A0A1H8NBQ6_9SPHI|nr:acyltransferase family protein [Mucilaginibacter gossypiicola]SEO26948.1 Fucose 4-O-acetylase [Mucilaginibacter gossypiicola]
MPELLTCAQPVISEAEQTGIFRNWVLKGGVGIILVVFGHVIKGLITVKLIDPVFFYYAVNFVYSFHMPLFFILSGYFFVKSFLKRGAADFTVNKLETIIYPYVVWSLIQTFIEIRLSAYTNNHTKASELFTCLYLPRSQFWFLFALFFINILNVLLFKISVKWGAFLSIIIWWAYYFLNYKVPVFDKALLNLLYFTAGILLSQYNHVCNLIIKNSYLFAANLLVFAASLYVYFNFPQTSWYNLIIPQLSGSFVIMYLSEKMTYRSGFSFLEYLGVNSLVIYLVHMLAGNGTRIFLAKILHVNNSIVHIVLGTLMGILIPLAVLNIASKTKYLSWLFKFPLLKKTKGKNSGTVAETIA